jgi:selenide,water dikinase
MEENDVRLTSFSHGAGCGCKISPGLLSEILSGTYATVGDNRLLVGNHSRDDAAVYDLGNGQCLISTTDFFMPIVDDAYDFGRIASANAISDIYAMGGAPILAIAILGWPIDKIAPAVAKRVIEGARVICAEAGIQLAGGHSIDSPEPIFGLAVNGVVPIENIKRNDTARDGDLLYLTKSLGVGILTTAEKKSKLLPEDAGLAAAQMIQLNKIGTTLGLMPEINALTDVTGFGLGGHLMEMVKGANLGATILSDSLNWISPNLKHYLSEGCIPGGSHRNWNSYGSDIMMDESGEFTHLRNIISDPQTSGGLLISVSTAGAGKLEKMLRDYGLERYATPIGRMVSDHPGRISVI